MSPPDSKNSGSWQISNCFLHLDHFDLFFITLCYQPNLVEAGSIKASTVEHPHQSRFLRYCALFFNLAVTWTETCKKLVALLFVVGFLPATVGGELSFIGVMGPPILSGWLPVKVGFFPLAPFGAGSTGQLKMKTSYVMQFMKRV